MGVTGVLEAITRIPPQSVWEQYYRLLLKNKDLTKSDLVQVMQSVKDKLDADSFKVALLRKVKDQSVQMEVVSSRLIVMLGAK